MRRWSDLLGRIGSYAQLYYVGDTTDPKRAQILRRHQCRSSPTSRRMLLFFELELNRIEDDALDSKP